jgi:hypothetical protein
MGRKQDYRKLKATKLYDDVALAEKIGLVGWGTAEVLQRLRAATDPKERSALAQSLREECGAALKEHYAAQQAPREAKRPRPAQGALVEGEGGDDDTPEGTPTAPQRPGPAKRRRDSDTEFRPHTGGAASTSMPQPASDEESSSSDEEAPPPQPPAPAAPPMPQEDMRLTTEEVAESLSGMRRLTLPDTKQPEAATSPHAERILTQLRKFMLPPGGADEASVEVQGMLKPGVEPMEHQRRTALFLRDAVDYFRVAGNALDCGMGKTLSTIVYVLHMRLRHETQLAVIYGKGMLFGTWEQEITRCLPEESYVLANVGSASFATIGEAHTWRQGALDRVRAGLREGKLVFLYLQLHVLNKPFGVTGLVAGVVRLANGNASLIVEESHEQCRNLNVPSEALGAIARECRRGVVLVSGTPVMTDPEEARHMIVMASGELHRDIDAPNALKVWQALCFRGKSDAALPPLHTWMLRVPGVQGRALQGLTGQARSRAIVHGNRVEASEHTKFQAAAAAALALTGKGRGTLVCAENRAGVQQLREMLRPTLEQGGGGCFLLCGDTTDPEREEALSSMRGLCAAGRPVVVIATPQVAGAGLNMQALSAVVVVGLYWAVQELQQTVARVHRIGQSRGCLCIALVTGQEDQTLLDIMQEKMHSTAAYYGDKSGLMLPRDHVERLGVCEVEAVGGIVEEMRACLEEGTAGPPSDRGAAKWPLLCKGA